MQLLARLCILVLCILYHIQYTFLIYKYWCVCVAAPAGGTPSSWLPASPSPTVPGGHLAAPPRISLPRSHHALGLGTGHRVTLPLERHNTQTLGTMADGRDAVHENVGEKPSIYNRIDVPLTNRYQVSSLSTLICCLQTPCGLQAEC